VTERIDAAAPHQSPDGPEVPPGDSFIRALRAGFMHYGMIATGDHRYFDWLRGAPRLFSETRMQEQSSGRSLLGSSIRQRWRDGYKPSPTTGYSKNERKGGR